VEPLPPADLMDDSEQSDSGPATTTDPASSVLDEVGSHSFLLAKLNWVDLDY
jgi:hypothetical protein